ncbi:ATP-binding protein [Cellulomonas sp. SG140]|uniref:ATP-binding protein n=1 Tax=Cellulomonas sp. SG140 TaxID=2976536 RepID=UPI0021E73E95|nr:ATP-binding protein [Cellulomonas sp. SG140]
MSAWFRSRAGHYSAGPALRVPAHRASSAVLAGAYPFLAPPTVDQGVPVGVDLFSGGAFCFDPWTQYADGTLTNPNVLLAGVIGQGKSALAKSLALRSIAAGRTVYVPGDPKGEWAVVADAVGGTVLRLGPGSPTRLNPLEVVGEDRQALRSQLLAGVASATLRRDLTAAEHSALDAALAHLSGRGTITIREVIEALVSPDTRLARADGMRVQERAADGRDLVHGLRRLVSGDLAGLFDAPTTDALDRMASMVVLDLSALGSDDDALAIASTCAAAWVEGALASSTNPRWVIYDEAWRLLRHPGLIRRMQAQWKLSRAYGIANLLVLHRLSDLDAVGHRGSETRALADGLLADCSTRVIYRQEADQLAAATASLGLTEPERDLLPLLSRGTGLWKLPGRSHVVQHVLLPIEEPLVDTDAAMRVGGWS